MSLEDAIIHIRIEEQNKTMDKAKRAKEPFFKENVVEERPRPKNNRPKRQNPKTKPNISNKIQNPTFKKKENCFVCGKLGHHALECRNKKRFERVNPRKNLAKAYVITAVVSFEVSMVTNMKDWIVDSRVTRHICGNGSAFTS